MADFHAFFLHYKNILSKFNIIQTLIFLIINVQQTLQYNSNTLSNGLLNAINDHKLAALDSRIANHVEQLNRNDRETVITFTSSICYGINSKASLKLRCPPLYKIETKMAFTAMSSSDSCSYDTWDCILQEGVTQKCDGRNQCSIVAVYEESTDALLQCGPYAHGKYMYFQVEYRCKAENGFKAPISTPETTTTIIRLNLEDVINMNETIIDFKDSDSVVDDKTALVGILGGCTLAMVLLIAIISSCIYKIKTRASKLEGYRTAASGISSMCSEAILTDPELIRQPRRNFQYDYRRQTDRQQPFGRGFTIWNGRSTTYTENDRQ